MNDVMLSPFVCRSSWWLSTLPTGVVQALQLRHVLSHAFSPDGWGHPDRPLYRLTEVQDDEEVYP